MDRGSKTETSIYLRCSFFYIVVYRNAMRQFFFRKKKRKNETKNIKKKIQITRTYDAYFGVRSLVGRL